MKHPIPESHVDGFFKREGERYHTANNQVKKCFANRGRINQIAVALTHYLFRNGVVEDMHSNGQLSNGDMKKLNKFMVNRLAGLLLMMHSDRWMEIEALLQQYRFCGTEWDAPEPDVGEIEAIWRLLHKNCKEEKAV